MKRRRIRSNIPNNNTNSTSDNSTNDNYDFSSSTILTSKYGHESTRLIHVVEKNLLLIMAIIVAMAVLSILNTLGVLEHLYSHDVDYIFDVILSVILVVVLVPLIILLLKSRRTLDRWTDMFERNTIVTTMNIAMTNRSKEEAILALPNSIQQISEPLQEYIYSKRNDMSEFLNVSVNNLVFNVLIDADRVLIDGSSNSSSKSNNNLKRVLKEYGGVIIKIIDGDIRKNLIESFADSLIKYNSITGHRLGMGLVIGDSLTDDAKEYANKTSFHRKRGLARLVLIAKPSSSAASPPPQQA